LAAYAGFLKVNAELRVSWSHPTHHMIEILLHHLGKKLQKIIGGSFLGANDYCGNNRLFWMVLPTI